MKSLSAIAFTALGLLTCVSNATAIPADQAGVRRSADGMTTVEMEVTDDRFPGITFKGTAESVYAQMKALKPEAFPDVNSANLDSVDTVQERSVYENVNCEWGGHILGQKSCQDGMRHLQKLDRSWCCVRGEFEHCAVVSCSYKCGIYLCNKRNTAFCAACGDIAADMDKIENACSFDWPGLQIAAGAVDFDDHFTGRKYNGDC